MTIFKSEVPPVPTSTESLQEKILTSIFRRIDTHPEKIALICAEDPSIRISYKQLNGYSAAAASFLYQRGIGHLDVVCQVLPNSIEYVVFYLSVLRAGGIVSGASAMFTDFEMQRQFLDSQSKCVITNEENLDRVLKAVNGCPKVTTVICVRSTRKPLPKGVFSYEQVISTPTVSIPKYPYNAEDTCVLPYSSGTTGSPKGVMLSHRTVGTMLSVLNDHFERFFVPSFADEGFSWATENFCLNLPFYHIYGYGLMNQVLLKGATGVVLKKFDKAIYLRTIQDFKIRTLFLVPPILLFLTKEKITDNYDLSCIRNVVSGAAPVGEDLCKEFLKKFPKAKLAQAYGMTECSMACHLPKFEKSDVQSVGILLSTFEQKILDISTGKPLGVNQRGEIVIRSPSIMKGYLNRPEATASTLDKDGWLHTGDIGFVNERGETTIVDRVKELIKVKGLQVAPAELEDLLQAHPDIFDAAVIGIPDERTGEKPLAFVVRRENSRLMESQVQKYVEGKVSNYKWLAGGVRFVDEIPKSPSGKILRRFLRDQFVQDKSSSNIVQSFSAATFRRLVAQKNANRDANMNASQAIEKPNNNIMNGRGGLTLKNEQGWNGSGGNLATRSNNSATFSPVLAEVSI
ncbi:hypothetical protein WR25_15349 [Diploscapter pachys]|uniref:AMP-dependent synthetase/ligase domain-containing protein n=1 Tax=Diploscapter pachys TaxID=2018661 RepID=A0A2A2KLK8_9BILA|nr:hypothetical protein WR25_15349 [Diploscapter pachys]